MWIIEFRLNYITENLFLFSHENNIIWSKLKLIKIQKRKTSIDDEP